MQAAIAQAFHSPFSTGGSRFHDPAYEGYVDTVTYGCWKRATLLELGGFDEGLVRNQDDELNLRINRAGLKVWQTPRIKSWYFPRASLRQLALQYYQYGYWKWRVFRKHHIPASFRQVVPILLILAIAVSAIGIPFFGLLPFVAVLSTYGLGLIWASIHTCLRNGDWRHIWRLPVIFAAFHLPYGLGMFIAILSELAGGSRRSVHAEQLSR